MRIFPSTLRPVVIATLIAALPAAGSSGAPQRFAPVRFDGGLSVMTYNIHGLPWPLAWNRPAGFSRIAATLRSMRARGDNPRIVLIQEAFTADAQAIGREAGYRYVADGPDDDAVNSAPPPFAEKRFAADQSWSHGEGVGKFVGSGLMILSDFPIVGVHRMVFPRYACAGFDCLANKGALLARISVPGRPDPIDIVTTHLNSRRASDVADARSNHAHSLQLASLSAFIRQWHDPRDPLIVGGDFNAGQTAERRSELVDHADRDWSGGAPVDSAYAAAEKQRLRLSRDARLSERGGRDWEFFASGKTGILALRRIDTPFGHDASGTMLSDHIGYVATYSYSS